MSARRIVHLVDPAAPGAGPAMLRLLGELVATRPALAHEIVLVGTSAEARLAARCGAAPTCRLGAPFGFAPLAWSALRSAWRDLRAAGPIELVLAWSPTAFVLARAARLRAPVSAIVGLRPWSGARLAALAARRRPPLALAAPSATLLRAHAAAGFAGRRQVVVPPGAAPGDAAADAETRAALRRAWGVPDGALVVGAVAQPPAWCDVRHAMSVVGRLRVTGRDGRLVIPANASDRRQAMSWTRALGLADAMIVDERAAEPWRIAPGLDAALALDGSVPCVRHGGARPSPGLLPALHVLAHGVPLLAEAGADAATLVREGENGYVVAARSIREPTDRLVRLHDDPALRARLGAAARAAVSRDHAPTAFAAAMDVVLDRH